MKICFLAPANSYHTIKWGRWFSDHGHDVYVLSFTQGKIDGIKVFWIDSGAEAYASDLKKLKYLFQSKKIKKIIDTIEPDIVNVHYATSYGAVAALSGIKDYFLSVWGSDVYTFPNKSFFHRELLKFSLNHAKILFSTSEAMAQETNKYTDKKIYITPFGVDMNLFNSNKRNRNNGKFVVGNIKSLDKKYGIDVLLYAIDIIVKKRPDINIDVRIAGKGPEEDNLKKLSNSLNISSKVTWLGFISQKEVAYEWANMDVAVISSISESFGVSAVEAQASGIPVIITDIPGLEEATSPGISSIVVHRNEPDELAEAIIALFSNKELRMKMGKRGREFVTSHYEIDSCFENVEKIFALYREQ